MEFLKNFDFQAFLEIIKDDPRLLIFAAIGVLLVFILLVWIFSSDSKPKKRSFTPADPPKIINYVEKLGVVSEQGREIIDYLDNEINKKTAELTDKTQQVESLRQEQKQIEDALKMYQEQPHEYISTTQKAHKQELQHLQKIARREAFQKWFFGFLFGILLSGGAFLLFWFREPLKNLLANLGN